MLPPPFGEHNDYLVEVFVTLLVWIVIGAIVLLVLAQLGDKVRKILIRATPVLALACLVGALSIAAFHYLW